MNSITISRMVGCLALGLTLVDANAKADEHGFLSQGPVSFMPWITQRPPIMSRFISRVDYQRA